MPTMKVYLLQSFSKVVTVEAETTDEAIEKAGQLADFGLCHECNGHMDQDGDAEPLYVFDENDNTIRDLTKEDGA